MFMNTCEKKETNFEVTLDEEKAMAHVTKGNPSKVLNIPCIEGHLSIWRGR
jgi:hypothetical protein